MDVFSRKIVGWEVFEQESAEHAAAVFTAAHRREGVPRHALVLHADNGSPMKCVFRRKWPPGPKESSHWF